MVDLLETTLVKLFAACQDWWIVLMLMGQRFSLCLWVAVS